MSYTRSRFEVTALQRIQQGLQAKAALKSKVFHVPEGDMALCGLSDFSSIEQRARAASLIPSFGPRPNAMPMSEPYRDDYVREPIPAPAERLCFPRGSGYGEWKFDHSDLKKRAEALVKHLPRVMQEVNADHIVVRGTSGTMMAPVLLYLMPGLKVVMLRKQSEHNDCHGARIEGASTNVGFKRGLIIDDMVATGRTVRGMVADHECDIVGILCHSGAGLFGVEPRRLGLHCQGMPHYVFS